MTTEAKKPNALAKPVKVDAALGKFLGGKTEELRTEVTKAIWAYIKANNLQDPKNKQTIVPDETLATIIGKYPIHMMKMTSEVNKHFIKEAKKK